MTTETARSFYVIGGTMPRDAPSYVTRRADDELLDGLRAGRFCYVLTSRQMGKSSLMVRAVTRLRQEGAACCAVLDLTAIGQNLSAERWYDGLLNQLGYQLDLEDELEDFWLAHAQERLGPLQRWVRALREVILKHRSGNLVVFVDEIDAVRSLPFSADEFFAGIRECYNRRTEDPEFARLTFCLVGVATPSDLIRDTRTTPFNIGRRVELTDFTPAEAAPLAHGLGRDERTGAALLNRVLFWTGGHPFLTQRLCDAVAGDGSAATSADVDRVCEALFLAPSARERDDNLLFVRERLLRSADADIAGLLELYGQVRAGRCVPDDETNPLVSVLRLSGVTRSAGGLLRVRNRIYEHVFDRAWIAANMPDAELRRQKAAFRRGVLRTACVFLAALAVLAALTAWAVRSAAEAQQARQKASLAARNAQRQARRADEKAEEARESAERAEREKRAAQAANARSRRLARDRQAALDDALAQKRRADRNARRAQDEAKRAEDEARRATQEAGRAGRAEWQGRLKLGESYFAQARASRWSGRPGRRFDSLAALTKTAAILGPSLELRNEAIAALALEADLRLNKRLVAGPQGTEVIVSDLAHGRYARAEDARGTLSVRSLTDPAHETVRLPGPGDRMGWVRFSPDGRLLAVRYGTGGNPDIGRLRVWDIARRSVVFEAANATYRALAFRPDSRTLAYGTSDGQVHVYDLAARKQARVFDCGQPFGPPYTLCFRPDGHALACGSLQSRELLLGDLTTGAVSRSACPDALFAIAWHPEGRLITLACRGNDIYVRDTATGRTKTLKGHQSQPSALAFSHGGNLLASHGWDGQSRLWNSQTGKLLVSAATHGGNGFPEWSADDRLLLDAGGTRITTWDVASNPAARTYYGSVVSEQGGQVPGLDFSADGSVMVTASGNGESGVQVWNLRTGREAARLAAESSYAVLFHPDGGSLWTSGASGVRRWPLRWDRSKATMRFGPPCGLGEPAPSRHARLSRDGRVLAVLEGDSVHVWDTRNGARLARLPGHWEFSDVPISPDGRWIAAISASDGRVQIWDARSGKRVHILPVGDGRSGATAQFTFSPDGRWLVTGETHEYRFWEVDSWRLGRRIPRPSGTGIGGRAAFSPDGSVLALTHSPLLVRLLHAATGRLLATLESPDPYIVSRLRFSPDGSLLAVSRENNTTQVWDLRGIRQNLTRMGLDWDLPPYPPPPARSRTRTPLTVQVIPITPLERARRQIAGLAQAVAERPDDPLPHNNLAWHYVIAPEGLRDPRKALPLAQRAVRLAPGNGMYLNTLGVIYYRLGECDKAAATLRDSLKASAGKTDAFDLFFLAMTYHHLGDPKQARTCFDQAVTWWKAQPQLPPAWVEELTAFRAEAQAVLGLPESAGPQPSPP